MAYRCTLKVGNLLDEPEATFIVNASNTTLQLGSGVSAAFKKACGIALQREMDACYRRLELPLKKGDVVATSSGEAKHFLYALHLCVMDYNQGVRREKKLPTLREIEDGLENIERYLRWYAQKHPDDRIKLVLPLLGCGAGGLDPGEVLGLYERFFSREVSFECEVVVYMYTSDVYRLAEKICCSFLK